MLIPFFILLGVDVFFIVFGIVFMFGKGTSLIAGYNTASVTERSKYNEKALCTAMGYLMFIMAACWLVAAFGVLAKSNAVVWVGIALFLVATVAGVIYMNTSKKIKRR